jgi:hypothetical protein
MIYFDLFPVWRSLFEKLFLLSINHASAMVSWMTKMTHLTNPHGDSWALWAACLPIPTSRTLYRWEMGSFWDPDPDPGLSVSGYNRFKGFRTQDTQVGFGKLAYGGSGQPARRYEHQEHCTGGAWDRLGIRLLASVPDPFQCSGSGFFPVFRIRLLSSVPGPASFQCSGSGFFPVFRIQLRFIATDPAFFQWSGSRSQIQLYPEYLIIFSQIRRGVRIWFRWKNFDQKM